MSKPIPVKKRHAEKFELYDPDEDEDVPMEENSTSEIDNVGDTTDNAEHHLNYKIIEGPKDVPVPKPNYKIVTLHGDRVREKPESECVLSKSLPSEKTANIPDKYKDQIETGTLKYDEMQTEDELHEEMTEMQMRPTRARAHVQKRLSELLDEEEEDVEAPRRSSLVDPHSDRPQRKKRTSFCDIEDVVEYKTYEAAHKCNSEPFLKIERPDPITAMRAQGVHPNTIMMMQMGF